MDERERLMEALLELCGPGGKRLRREDLPGVFGDVPLEKIDDALDELSRQGRLVTSKKGRFTIPEALGMSVAKVLSTASGYTFLSIDGVERDAYLSDKDVSGALMGDTVLAKIRDHGDGRSTAIVERVLERANENLIGIYSARGYVTPSDKRILARFAVGDGKGARENDLVEIQVTDWTYPEPEAEIRSVLGARDDKKAQLRAIIHANGLEEEFSPEARTAAENAPTRVSQSEIEGREDLRAQPCVTIDGSDAKDFDDAVFAEKIPDGWRLYVHIADVSHYVRAHSPLERDAYERGTSVYLLDTVLPMLPEQLSNGICSLNPGVDRLAFTCVMDVDGDSGDVTDYRLAHTVIRSSGRLVYEDVTRMLEGDAVEALEPHAPMLRELEKLTQVLRDRRAQRGAIDFDLPEPDIRLDEQGKPLSVTARERGVANQMIEECMLLANETVARHAINLDLPFLYRVHEDPSPDKIKAFAVISTNLGYPLRYKRQGVHPRQLSALLESVRGKPEEAMLSTLMLRSLQRARYDAGNLGHYGLALRDYCHFTSPIRRYPDLFIHRVLSAHLHGKLDEQSLPPLMEKAREAALHSSARERAAADAEKELDDLKKAEYMQGHVGEKFDGVISGLAAFGIFVVLPNTVTGMVPLREMRGDQYTYVEKEYKVIGRRTKKSFRLGDRVTVVCSEVDTEQRKVEFMFADSE